MKPSLFRRIVIGKSIGLLIGLIAFFMLPLFWPEADLMLRTGILLWYITFGAVIAITGVITYHPILHLPLPWWFRSSFMGGWLNFVLVFFAYKDMEIFLNQVFESPAPSPFVFIIEGVLVGLIIGFFATRFAGEGKESVDT